MKVLLTSLWTDPKVGLGVLTLLATSIGLLLTTSPVSIPVAIGTVLLNAVGGGVLLHSDSPWKTAGPPTPAPLSGTPVGPALPKPVSKATAVLIPQTVVDSASPTTVPGDDLK